MLHCNTDATHLQHNATNCNGDIEKEKEEDIELEKEKEKYIKRKRKNQQSELKSLKLTNDATHLQHNATNCNTNALQCNTDALQCNTDVEQCSNNDEHCYTDATNYIKRNITALLKTEPSKWDDSERLNEVKDIYRRYGIGFDGTELVINDDNDNYQMYVKECTRSGIEYYDFVYLIHAYIDAFKKYPNEEEKNQFLDLVVKYGLDELLDAFREAIIYRANSFGYVVQVVATRSHKK